ncbi:hypothetical protein MMC34_008531 [Xylographa carneopallida]|nr:hypothetical protein [Xylographa carneopallida]
MPASNSRLSPSSSLTSSFILLLALHRSVPASAIPNSPLLKVSSASVSSPVSSSDMTAIVAFFVLLLLACLVASVWQLCQCRARAGSRRRELELNSSGASNKVTAGGGGGGKQRRTTALGADAV